MTLAFLKRQARMFRQYVCEEDALALTETVILFPVLVTMMMGVYDLGNGIIVSQKTITAAQIVGDLVTRKPIVTEAAIADSVIAGQLALAPYSVESFGADVVGVVFDEAAAPEVDWRYTHNMGEDDIAVANSEGLGGEGDGVVVVTVKYVFRPFFTHFVVEQIGLEETFYLHSRRSAVVICEDCGA